MRTVCSLEWEEKSVGSVLVDQLGRDGELTQARDITLSNARKNELLLAALPGARIETYAGERAVRFGDQLLLKKQVTHLGNPWPGFKKRIQIPRKWVNVHRQASAEGLDVRFIGIYHFEGVTIFVDFDPTNYVLRKANNSAAHVATNDLFQAQTLGQFRRVDRNGNGLTSVRSDEFAAYLRQGYAARQPRIDVFRQFNEHFITGATIEALDAVREMYEARWPDTFQGEWPGFYLEYRIDRFLRQNRLTHLVAYQKMKGRRQYDYDLVFQTDGLVDYYGDLKASNVLKPESPGNDAAAITQCVREFGRFWYVICEHETTHARDHAHRATIAWNEWKRSVGYTSRRGFDPLSYAGKFKESVRFVRLSILELNPANMPLVLGTFRQGQQQGGASRALKVMIQKKNIDNFLVFSSTPESVPGAAMSRTHSEGGSPTSTEEC